MRYSLVLFDFDGTLADSLSRALAIYHEIAPGLGLKPILDVAVKQQTQLKELRLVVDKLDKQIDVRGEVLVNHEERLSRLEQRRDARRRADKLAERLADIPAAEKK